MKENYANEQPSRTPSPVREGKYRVT